MFHTFGNDLLIIHPTNLLVGILMRKIVKSGVLISYIPAVKGVYDPILVWLDHFGCQY